MISSPASVIIICRRKSVTSAWVFQAFAVWPHLSVYENVAFPLQAYVNLPASEIEKRTKDALRSTNLLKVAEDSPADLSGGGKQRVALARALAINPDVMLLDEPLSSLDPHLREEMRFEIKDLQRKYGFSIIYVTHDQAEAMALSDRILVMKLGVVQQIDTPFDVYNKPANKFVFSFIGLSNFLDITWRTAKPSRAARRPRSPKADPARSHARQSPAFPGKPPVRDRLCERGRPGRTARRRQPQSVPRRNHRLSGENRRPGTTRPERTARPRPGTRRDLLSAFFAPFLVCRGRVGQQWNRALFLPG